MLRSALFALSLVGSAAALSRRQDGATTADAPGTKRYILEVSPGTDVDALSAKLGAKEGSTVLKTFKSEVFTGLSIESDTENFDTLIVRDEVAQAWPAARIQLAPLVSQGSFGLDYSAPNYSVHGVTGVDKAHAAGYFGKGVKIAIVDTGTDYTHPALGGGFGPGYKVAGGYDLVGDGYWAPGNYGYEKEPDDDPMDFLGHGTHVAGIIAGKLDWFSGVAPEATLLSYKVFTSAGGTDEDTLIEAFILAFEAGADVITSSIGMPSGWGTGAWASVASRIVEEGVVVTISAGNQGDDGPLFFGSGSAGKNVLGVASVQATTVPALPFKATLTVGDVPSTVTLGYIQWRDYQPWTIKDWPVITLPDNADGCNPLPAGDYNFTGKVVLVPRGECWVSDIQDNTLPYGAEYIVIYNNDKPFDPTNPPYPYYFESDAIMVDKPSGEALLKTLEAGGTVTVDFSQFLNYVVGSYNSAGGRPYSYTSWGPTYDLDLKPDIAAPGGNILSSVPGGWDIYSGTSMACPYVAGVAALYIGKYGGRSVHGKGFGKDMQRRIIASGGAMPWNTKDVLWDESEPYDWGFWAPPQQVGGGMVNAWKILDYKTTLNYEKIALNDTLHFSRYHKVDITNNAETTVEYRFTLQPAGGIEAKSTYPTGLALLSQLTPLSIVPNVSFPGGTFKVKSGETKTAQFNFKAPEGANADKLPFYGGKVLISSSTGEELSVPYHGAAFDIKKEFDTVFESGTPYQQAGLDREDIYEHHAYTFNTDRDSYDWPAFYVGLKYGTSQLRADIYESGWKERSWTYPPVVGENGYIGSATTFADSEGWSYFDPTWMDKEFTISFPIFNLVRNSPASWYQHQFFWFGKLSNSSYIAPGTYTLRFAALRPFGHPERADNWAVWKTPEITVLPLVK